MRSILMTIAIFLIVVQPTLAVELIVESKNLGIDDHEFTINITLTKAVNGISGYNVSLTIDKPSVAQIKSIKFPDWATLNDYSKTSNKIWIKALDLNENIQNQATNVTLATIVFSVKRLGISHINITSFRIDDDLGYSLEPHIVNGTVVIDINRNGQIDIGDVCYVAYVVVKKLPQNAKLDFNGNGRVDIGDLAKIVYYILGKIEEI